MAWWTHRIWSSGRVDDFGETTAWSYQILNGTVVFMYYLCSIYVVFMYQDSRILSNSNPTLWMMIPTGWRNLGLESIELLRATAWFPPPWLALGSMIRSSWRIRWRNHMHGKHQLQWLNMKSLETKKLARCPNIKLNQGSLTRAGDKDRRWILETSSTFNMAIKCKSCSPKLHLVLESNASQISLLVAG